MSKLKMPIKFTYEDYKNLPDSEVKRYELLDGDLVMTPSPTWRHQDILLKLLVRLEAFVTNRNLGRVACAPLDVILGDDVVQPDILFISREKADIIQEVEVQGAPDLIIEILSASTAQRDRTYKRTLYARHGVREYWLVDPDAQSVEILTLGVKGYRQVGRYEQGHTLKSSLLSGLATSLDEVF